MIKVLIISVITTLIFSLTGNKLLGQVEPITFQEEGKYSNPVVPYSLPDPTIIKAADGFFYLYATEDIRNTPIHKSSDLVNWKLVGTAFTAETRPTFEPKGGIWAPDINIIDGRYVLYYSMSVWGGEMTCGIGVAVSDKPEGPFKDLGKLIRSNEIGVQNSIDPFYIEDEGRKYIFWGSFHGIYAIELSEDGLTLRPGAEKILVAGSAYEGTYILKKGKYYYLFASTGTCCEGVKSTYKTVVGRSSKLFGPYLDKQGKSMNDNFHEILIGGNERFVGTGHNSEIVEDQMAKTWILYHAVDKTNPKGRVLLLDEVKWKDEWPYVEGNSPALSYTKPVFTQISLISPASRADKAFDAWYKSYDIESVKGFFWDNAEMMEVVLDAYEVTKDPKYRTMFEAMYKNFVAKNGADWQNNKYNDDIAWAVLVSIRGYLLTGNTTYKERAKDQFDKMWTRAFTNSYGGGLLWYHTKTTKNSCINGPAMVACCYLAKATGDSTYYDKAIALYTWSKLYLFDAETGKLNDNVDLDLKTGQLKISTWSSTYNQGTYLGAATMLYKYTKENSYLTEAQRIALYIRDTMYSKNVMNNEYNGNDLPGFKGIFARYARMYTVDLNKTDLVEWLQLNAETAWDNRNSQDLIHTRWATKTDETKPESAFGCSTAVSLFINVLPFTTIE
ncbi:MAG: family 43 glycosylhydrolase [Bacteroidales bacterium]|nr:family 43 glycosylhydrolase [Bacteroidales bacterium]